MDRSKAIVLYHIQLRLTFTVHKLLNQYLVFQVKSTITYTAANLSLFVENYPVLFPASRRVYLFGLIVRNKGERAQFDKTDGII